VRSLLLIALSSLCVLIWSPAAQPEPAATLSGPHDEINGSYPFSVQWVRVEQRSPNVVYVGGSFDCIDPQSSLPTCNDWALRSTDGGGTWTDLRPALHVPRQISYTGAVVQLLLPLVIASDDHHLYMSFNEYAPGAGPMTVSRQDMAASSDGGMHWVRRLGPNAVNTPASFTLALSASPTQLYAVSRCGDCSSRWVSISSDGGVTWRNVVNPLDHGLPCCGGDLTLVPDPVRPATLYANLSPTANPPSQSVAVMRSENSGLTWTQVTTPTTASPLHTFAVSTDPNEGGLLVGTTADHGVPADRRYLSPDHGKTWHVATCPGDVQGHCPAFTVRNVFGPGASYGLVQGGIYLFHGGLAAQQRLPASARLPLSTASLLDVAAGRRAGDLIYLLGRGWHAPMHNLLYRSTNGGKTWQLLLTNVVLAPDMPLRVSPTARSSGT